MKKYTIGRILFLACALCTMHSALGYDFPAGKKKNSFIDVTVRDISQQNGQLVTLMDFDLSNVSLKGNSEIVVTPVYTDGNGNMAALEPFTVAGRNRFYWLERNRLDKGLALFKGWGSHRGHDRDGNGSLISLESSIPYEPWMEQAVLSLDVKDLGCANCSKGENDYPLAETDFTTRSYEQAEFIYVTPVAEAVKMREISARAYIDFKVNRTEIEPTYRRNPQELAKIRATIDSIRNDKDISVTSLHISGTASPEGSYQNNVRLAKGRTEALKDYVQKLYKFPAGFITTSFEPVDWAGLAEALTPPQPFPNREGAQSSAMYQEIRENVPHAEQILAIVNGDLEPYARNQKIRTTYPKEYAWLLANVYPALRHSDYKIEFEIKTYTEVSEIIEVMQTSPQKLSLAELFVAANSQPEGSDLYNRAFELAVTMFPQDETANLNAGIAAMKRNDLVTAQRYLANAGESPEAEYARAVYYTLLNDYDTARLILSNLTSSPNATVAAQAKALLQNWAEVDAANAITWRLL